MTIAVHAPKPPPPPSNRGCIGNRSNISTHTTCNGSIKHQDNDDTGEDTRALCDEGGRWPRPSPCHRSAAAADPGSSIYFSPFSPERRPGTGTKAEHALEFRGHSGKRDSERQNTPSRLTADRSEWGVGRCRAGIVLNGPKPTTTSRCAEHNSEETHSVATALNGSSGTEYATSSRGRSTGGVVRPTLQRESAMCWAGPDATSSKVGIGTRSGF